MKTILVVDDEFGLLENLVELLLDEGYEAVSAANGKDGLLRLQEASPALVITDFMMPIADGAHLVRGMRALPEFVETPVIMMSATPPSVALAGGLAVSAFLRKPVDWDTLAAAIVRLIGEGDASHRR